MMDAHKWELLESSPDDGGLTIFADCEVVCEHIASPEIGRVLLAAPDTLAELRKAESFISGFEGDELQEGIAELLAGIRGAIAKASA